MSGTIGFVRLLPWRLFGRFATAFVEVALAAVVVSGSVVAGHQLREWRAWYWDPATTHPWAPTPRPTETAGAAAHVSQATARAVPTPMRAAVVATPAPACRTSSGDEQLAFTNPLPRGADCVWLALRSDGTHLIVGTYGLGPSDLGIVAMPRSLPDLHVYAPNVWQAPVIATVGRVGAATEDVLVFTWQGRQLVELLRTTGTQVDLAADATGWPRVSVTRHDGARAYAWDGRAYTSR